MIYDYDIDQEQKALQSEGIEQAYLDGIGDGSRGYPLRLKRMHDLCYIRGYVAGIAQWAIELEQREQDNLADSALEF